jgi:uncharacterized protein
MNTILLALFTGLTTGGISCFAVQGGLLTASIANQKKETQKDSVVTFLISKLIAYTLLGAALGLVGAALTITPKLQGSLQILAGIIMLATAGRILDIHPIFRKFTFTPPKSFYRVARSSSKLDSAFAPAILGFSTVLIPCGVTQSMMLLSIASGNAFMGGLIMAGFTLGTSPVFFAFGMASKALLTNRKLSYVAAGIITILAVTSINTGQILRGSVHTLQNYRLAMASGAENSRVAGASVQATINQTGKQEVTINAITGGYQSEITTLKVGVPVTLKLRTDNTLGCSRAFTIPEYNISTILETTGEKIVEFTPTKTGRLTYTCSMGMYTGQFTVVN